MESSRECMCVCVYQSHGKSPVFFLGTDYYKHEHNLTHPNLSSSLWSSKKSSTSRISQFFRQSALLFLEACLLFFATDIIWKINKSENHMDSRQMRVFKRPSVPLHYLLHYTRIKRYRKTVIRYFA